MTSAKKVAVLVLCTTLALSMVVFPFTQRAGPVELYEFDENEESFSTLHPVYTRCAKRYVVPSPRSAVALFRFGHLFH